MLREEKILHNIDKAGFGLEIGPSHQPIAPRRDGYKVHVLDHLSKEKLIEKYKSHGVCIDNIEEVDFVWGGESYGELTGNFKYYDWIIASHVIEHVPDLIGFLKNCDAILKDDGFLSLAIPDKRYCFDHYRPISGLSKVIDNHLGKQSIHTLGSVMECYLNKVTKAGVIGWDYMQSGEYKLTHTLEQAREKIKEVVNNSVYVDTHAWCFVPHSFRLIIQDLFDLGLSPFKEVDFFPTAGSEFFVTLSRKGRGLDKSRLEILEIIESEIAARDRMKVPSHRKKKKTLRSVFKSFLAELKGCDSL